MKELKAAAQQHFQRRLTLTAKSQQLDLNAALSEAGLRDGDVVAAVVQLGKLAATNRIFAWYAHGDEVVTWGAAGSGGDSSKVQEQLRNVQHIQATDGAFAAVLESGAVVTWGNPEHGGDSSQDQEQLRSVQHIQSTRRAFAAILESGAVVTWGDPEYSGDSSQVQEQLRNVQHIQATAGAFAAILESGAVVTSTAWRRQQPGARAAEERPAHSSNCRCFCRHYCIWGCCDLGSSRMGWRQQPRTRAAEERAARPSNCRCFCCHS